MDRKLNGPLMHFVLVLMLLEVNGNPLSWVSCKSHVSSTESLTRLLNLTINELQKDYVNLTGSRTEPIPDEFNSSSTISGANISEKLQDMCVKNKLFQMHLSQVNESLKELGCNPPEVLGRVHGHLRNQLTLLEAVLEYVDPTITVLPTPSPPQLPYDDASEKKIYGWGVIQSLKDWVAKVLPVLVQPERVCLNKTAGSR